jgi:hypothetical protein
MTIKKTKRIFTRPSLYRKIFLKLLRSYAKVYTPPLVNNYHEISIFYTSNAIKDIIKRHCAYLYDRPYLTLNDLLLPITVIGIGGAVGFAGAVQVAKTCKIEKELRTTFLVAGTIAGGITGACIYAGIKENSIFFKTWKLLKLADPTLQFVFKNHEKEQHLIKLG